MADNYSPELKAILTQLRAVLNEANRMVIENLRYQGNFEVDYNTALASIDGSRAALLNYYTGPVKLAFAALGRYLVVHEMTVKSPDLSFLRPSDDDIDMKYAVTGQRWYESIYPPMKVG